MIGLCVGIAINAEYANGETLEDAVRYVSWIIKEYKHPSVYMRDGARRYGYASGRYFAALDACPLRMRP